MWPGGCGTGLGWHCAAIVAHDAVSAAGAVVLLAEFAADAGMAGRESAVRAVYSGLSKWKGHSASGESLYPGSVVGESDGLWRVVGTVCVGETVVFRRGCGGDDACRAD